MKNTPMYILRLTLTLFLITALVAAALAGVNAITKDRIAALKAEKTQKAIAQVLPEGAGEATATAVDQGIVKTLYTTDLGYAVEVAPAGFSAEITMMVGVAEGKVTGIVIVSQTETAGLGAVAAAANSAGDAFRGQFVGQAGPFAVVKDGGQVDGISGATITSRAVTQAVNGALEFARNLEGEGRS